MQRMIACAAPSLVGQHFFIVGLTVDGCRLTARCPMKVGGCLGGCGIQRRCLGQAAGATLVQAATVEVLAAAGFYLSNKAS
jgi:hypothetical protein